MAWSTSALRLLLALAVCRSALCSSPNPVYDAAQYSKLKSTTANGKLYIVAAPDNTTLPVIHTWGNETERGVAYGTLLADELLQFVYPEVDRFFAQDAESLMKYISWMPEKWQQRIQTALDKDAPGAFMIALDLLVAEQARFIAAGRARVWEEVDGIAAGVCAVRPTASACKDGPGSLARRIRALNLMPELIQMQCSMMGAWGNATSNGKLLQLRSLDFGTGPFANNNLLHVAHPPAPGKAFAAVTFPSFVAAVTASPRI